MKDLSLKKLSMLNVWFTYISFSSSNGTKFFEKDNSLIYMQIWCILATCSEAKVYPTSTFQLIYFYVTFQAVGTIHHFTKTLETL